MVINRRNAACGNVMTARIALLATFVFAPVAASSQEDCRSITDDNARLACYDRLSAPAPPPAPQPAPADKSVERAAPPPPEEKPREVKVVPLDDSVAKERVLSNDEKTEVRITGRVVSCRKDATRKYLFYFDNGQIWRQKDNTNVRWRDCQFDVVITKDVFGYKMVAENGGRQVRVARLK